LPKFFVNPEPVRLELGEGVWILIKKELTAGDRRKAFGAMIKRMNMGEPTEIDPEQVQVSNVVAYLLDWNVTDVNGNPIVIRGASREVVTAALDNMTSEGYDAIAEAITNHIAALEAQKKIPSTAPESPATSESAG
jgi:hypothetical protein